MRRGIILHRAKALGYTVQDTKLVLCCSLLVDSTCTGTFYRSVTTSSTGISKTRKPSTPVPTPVATAAATVAEWFEDSVADGGEDSVLEAGKLWEVEGATIGTTEELVGI